MNMRQTVLGVFGLGKRSGSCCGPATGPTENSLKKIAIVGTPNVGKSVIFNRLTGTYVTVSNYPGTTVDVTRGKSLIAGEKMEVVDTPGMYSLMPITEEERVARLLLFEEKPQAVLHVVDARNLERMLPFTMQLIEAGFPVILDLNMIDEMAAAGIEIDVVKLEKELNVPVVATVATTGKGLNDLRRRLAEYVGHPECTVTI
ncbi:MAG: FeoB small GTPase domain-containing protein [Dehalococcoidia bacterium]|nr:FeoB small GTPase domain-containing protein [Dehalococcoidia bacterium]MDZ4245689.1 FeoB small GTPase domain-containing protein [Dehalococcoidia bacterium]